MQNTPLKICATVVKGYNNKHHLMASFPWQRAGWLCHSNNLVKIRQFA